MKLKNLLSDSLIYGLSGALVQVGTFFLIPIYTASDGLTETQVGYYGILVVTLQFLRLGLTLNLGSALYREILLNKQFPMRTLSGSAWAVQLGLAGIAAALLASYADTWSSFLGDGARAEWFLLLAGMAFAEVARDLPLNLLRINGKPVRFLIVNVGGFLTQFTVSAVLLLQYDWKVEGLLVGLIASRSAMAGVGWALAGFPLPFPVSFPALRSMLTFCLPLVPMSLAFLILNQSDRYILGWLTSMGEVGLYNTGYRLCAGLFIIVEAFQKAWPRFLYGRFADDPEGAPQFYADTMRLLIGTLSLAASLFIIWAEDIVDLITGDSKWLAAVDYIPPVALATLFHGMFYCGAVGVNLKKRTELQSLAVVIAASLNIALNIALVPRFGPVTAAWTTVGGYAVMGMLTVVFSQALYRVPYARVRIWSLVLLAMVVTAGWPLLREQMGAWGLVWWEVVLVQVGVSFGVGVIVGGAGVTTQDLRERV